MRPRPPPMCSSPRTRANNTQLRCCSTVLTTTREFSTYRARTRPTRSCTTCRWSRNDMARAFGSREDPFAVNLSAIRPWVSTVFRLVLGGVFLWAGWEQLADRRGFVQAVRAYDVTPEWLSKAIG